MAERGYDCFMLFYDGRLPYLVPPGTNIRQKCVGNIMFSTCAMVGSCWDDCLYDAGLL
jgi:hypothetical protein